MPSEKECLSWNLIATLFVLTILYVGMLTGIFIKINETVAWWVPMIQIFFFLVGILCGGIEISTNIRDIQIYIVTIWCLCFLPYLVSANFGLFSFPLFVGWALVLAGQLASWLKKVYSSNE